jgi:hypothetical protein
MVERATRYIVGWRVEQERTETVIQELVGEAPQAVLYYYDDFSNYSAVIYRFGAPIAMTDKSQTCGALNARVRQVTNILPTY